MNNSINCAGFVDTFVDSADDFEPYGYSILDAEIEHTQRLFQKKAIDSKDHSFTGE